MLIWSEVCTFSLHNILEELLLRFFDFFVCPLYLFALLIRRGPSRQNERWLCRQHVYSRVYSDYPICLCRSLAHSLLRQLLHCFMNWCNHRAPRAFKMAAGENPKRVYGSRNILPSTRMGNISNILICFCFSCFLFIYLYYLEIFYCLTLSTHGGSGGCLQMQAHSSCNRRTGIVYPLSVYNPLL